SSPDAKCSWRAPGITLYIPRDVVAKFRRARARDRVRSLGSDRTMTVDRRTFLLGTAGTAVALNVFSCAARDATTRGQGRRFKFVHVDVFTSRPFLGNPLDVFLDARGLSDAEMLAVARETYLSETTFVFPRDAATERDRGVRVRIFGPDGEI